MNDLRYARRDAPSKRQARGIVFWLSWADLRHEWLLTSCLIMAIAAVLSPLLLLFGLKYGTIETLRFRLIQDPYNREIKLRVSRSFRREWFESMQQHKDVGFIIPMTRSIAATVTASVQGSHTESALDLVPTGANDPLMLENAAPIPRPGECVLTHFAAEALNAHVGETIVVRANRRNKDGQYESGSMELRVMGILSLRASELTSMYVPLEVLEAVEHYKDGLAVPAYQWPGSTPLAYPQYNGLIVVLPHPLETTEQVALTIGTGFTGITPIDQAQLLSRAQFRLAFDEPSDMWCYFLSTQKRPVGNESVENVRQKLRGKSTLLLPWISPLQAQLLHASGSVITSLNLYALPAVTQSPTQPAWSAADVWRHIMLPPDLEGHGTQFTLKLMNKGEPLEFPVTAVFHKQLSVDSATRVAFVPTQLAGILTLYHERPFTYDETQDAFVLSRQHYAGFRLYAKTIDDIDALRKYFADQSIPVHTEAKRITDVLRLDTYLSLIFWFIAVVGIVGGVTALTASLYASVERKKRDLSVLRLLGLSGPILFRFPIYQGLLIGAGSFVVAMMFFQGIAAMVNMFFAAHLEPGERFCTLPLPHALGALVVTLLIAMLAATVAARHVTQLDPAEAMRDE